MSIAEFSDAFKNRIFTKFTSLTRAGKQEAVKHQDTVAIRKKYESASSGASAIFTSNGITNVMKSISSSIEDASLQKLADEVLAKINYTEFLSYVTSTLPDVNSLEVLQGGFKLNKVPQKTLRNLFLDYLSIVIGTTGSPLSHKLYDYVSHHIESGHLAGVFSLKMLHNLDLKAEFTGSSYRDFTISSGSNDAKTERTLEVILKALLDADYVSSNIVDREEIFLAATKAVLSDNPHLEVELQFKKDNKASGDLLQQAGNNLNKVLTQLTSSGLNNKDADDAFKKFAASLKPLSEMLLARASELQQSKYSAVATGIVSNAVELNRLATELIEIKGSPSLKESVSVQLINTITGKKVKPIVTNFKNTSKTTSTSKEDTKLNKAIKDFSTNISKLKTKTREVIKIKSLEISTSKVNLSSLLALINSNLQHVISANMGGGNETKILNYRSGRFASSVKVERLSESRAGMLTAFYNYMKYPYQTFQPGYAQGAPASRDPKILIGTSIREIAATKVGNQLRAISI